MKALTLITILLLASSIFSQCSSNCKTCVSGSTTSCASCDQKYLYNNYCYTCSGCYSSTYCTDTGCTYCSSGYTKSYDSFKKINTCTYNGSTAAHAAGAAIIFIILLWVLLPLIIIVCIVCCVIKCINDSNKQHVVIQSQHPNSGAYYATPAHHHHHQPMGQPQMGQPYMGHQQPHQFGQPTGPYQ